MRIKKTGDVFPGNHEPLVSAEMFETVQALLAGRLVDRKDRHVFPFSRFARCASCKYSLIAETRKGHVYYRCHNRPFKNPAVCPPTRVRAEDIDAAVLERLAYVDMSNDEMTQASASLSRMRADLEQNRADAVQAAQLLLDNVENRITRLTDLLIDGVVDKTGYGEKRNALLVEQAKAREKLAEAKEGKDRALDILEKTVGLAKSPSNAYKYASPEEKRELVKSLLSDVVVSGKKIAITLALPFQIIGNRDKTMQCAPYRGGCRTWDELINQLMNQVAALR